MSTPDRPPTPGRPDDAPDAETLERIAEPAVVRRAPRFTAFIFLGTLLGAVVGWLLGVLEPAVPGDDRAAAIGLTALGLACGGALLGAACAVLADRRSIRRR